MVVTWSCCSDRCRSCAGPGAVLLCRSVGDGCPAALPLTPRYADQWVASTCLLSPPRSTAKVARFALSLPSRRVRPSAARENPAPPRRRAAAGVSPARGTVQGGGRGSCRALLSSPPRLMWCSRSCRPSGAGSGLGACNVRSAGPSPPPAALSAQTQTRTRPVVHTAKCRWGPAFCGVAVGTAAAREAHLCRCICCN